MPKQVQAHPESNGQIRTNFLGLGAMMVHHVLTEQKSTERESIDSGWPDICEKVEYDEERLRYYAMDEYLANQQAGPAKVTPEKVRRKGPATQSGSGGDEIAPVVLTYPHGRTPPKKKTSKRKGPKMMVASKNNKYRWTRFSKKTNDRFQFRNKYR